MVRGGAVRTVADRWKIPASLREHVKTRDRACVYCRCKMIEIAKPGESRRRVATWEHIDNDIDHISAENICLCCMSCNASKGARSLTEWFAGDYCRNNKITPERVAEVVRQHLAGWSESVPPTDR